MAPVPGEFMQAILLHTSQRTSSYSYEVKSLEMGNCTLKWKTFKLYINLVLQDLPYATLDLEIPHILLLAYF